MKNFAQLIKTLDSSNKTNVKVDALTTYFKNASPEDKVWTIGILSHRRPPRPVNTTLLRLWWTIMELHAHQECDEGLISMLGVVN